MRPGVELFEGANHFVMARELRWRWSRLGWRWSRLHIVSTLRDGRELHRWREWEQ